MEAAHLSVRLATAAGALARQAFAATFASSPKTSALDVVTEIDRAAERLLIAGIRAYYPSHAIFAEESGAHCGSSTEWTWLLDPMDGTSNFTMGIPLYGVTIALRKGHDIRMAVVHDSHLGRHVVGVAEEPLVAGGGAVLLDPRCLPSPAVALQQGYGLARGDAGLGRLRSELEARYERVLYSWSPSIDLLLLLAGHLSAVIAVDCAGPEHAAARFLAERAGCSVHVVKAEGPPEAANTYVLAWPRVADKVLELVDETSLS